MDKKSVLINEMIKYYASDVKRINHFMKVYSFANNWRDGEGRLLKPRSFRNCSNCS